MKPFPTVQDTRLQSLAAELTSAAYPVLLRNGPAGSWVDLELGLWKSATETIGMWERELPKRSSPDEIAAWRKGLVASLTNGAVFVAREQGVRGSLPGLK